MCSERSEFNMYIMNAEMEKRPLQFTKKYVIVDKCITEGREMQIVVFDLVYFYFLHFSAVLFIADIILHNIT